MTHARNSSVMFEALEGRRLLSATPHVPVADDAQLVGDWSGKLKATVAHIYHTSLNFTMDVTSQSSTHLHLTIKVDGKTFSGVVPVHFEGGGHIVKFKFHTKNIDGSLKLWVASDNNSLLGKFEGSGHGIPASGSLSMTKEIT